MRKKVIVDTPVWIDHLIKRDSTLEELLIDDRVIVHEDVLGELACGNFKNRHEQLRSLSILDSIRGLKAEDVILFIETHRLYGRGPGWVDLNLLASALGSNVLLYTHDKKLDALAVQFKVKFGSHGPQGLAAISEKRK